MRYMFKSTYYLSDSSSIDSKYLVFEADFAASCKISKCYIIASSLYEAMKILYDQLSDKYDGSYLDNYLLSLKFVSCLINHSLQDE